MRKLGAVIFLAAAVAATGCVRLRPWERGHLATEPMEMDDCAAQRFERNVETYREGAVGANGGKSGGGCGCN